MRRPFLTARWESLVLLNCSRRREWLEPLVPTGTELDTWPLETLASLVGFLFRAPASWVSRFPNIAPSRQ